MHIYIYVYIVGFSVTLFEREVFQIKLHKCFQVFSTQVFSCEYCKIFTERFFNRTPPVGSVDLLLLIKNHVEWFLLKWFVDVVIVRCLHIISRNHSNTSLLINLQKAITYPK